MHLTYRFRLLPTKKQHNSLEEILEGQRVLYNAALEERISAYEKQSIPISKFDQFKSLTEIRQYDPVLASISVNLQRSTLERLDNAFKGFFNRMKKGAKAGFPRFKSRDRFNSFGFTAAPLLDGNRVYFKGGGSLRFRQHRALPGKPKTAWIKKDHKGWMIGFVVEVADNSPFIWKEPETGIDLGISDMAILSSGERIPNLRHAKKAERRMRVLQRALARCRRGSNRRRKVKSEVARLHARVANSRATCLHQVAARLAAKYQTIYVENLNVVGLARGMLAKPVHDVAWAKFLFLLTYKAERAGGEVIPIDPKYTSQMCSDCGVIEKKELSQRTHICVHCGLVLDRDHNAAKNILARGRSAVSGSLTKSIRACVEPEISV